MIDYFDGYVMLGFRNVLIYLRINKDVIDQTEKSDTVVEINEEKSTEIKQLNLQAKYKIICIQPLGSSGTSIVLETLNTRQIRFVRVEPKEKINVKHLKFVQLGVLVNHSPMTISKLLKYRSVCKYNPVTKKKYQVGIVVRENGRVEFYSDFILVNEYYNPKLQCVDIATDFNQFFLKFVKNAHEIDENEPKMEDLKY